MSAVELPGGNKPTLNEALGWIGSRVDDVYGTNVGRLEDVWIDPGTGMPRWLLVKEGLFGGRTTLLPFDDATAGAGHVWIPYERDVVREAPEIDTGAPLTHAVEAELRNHYAASVRGAGERFAQPLGATGRGAAAGQAQPAAQQPPPSPPPTPSDRGYEPPHQQTPGPFTAGVQGYLRPAPGPRPAPGSAAAGFATFQPASAPAYGRPDSGTAPPPIRPVPPPPRPPAPEQRTWIPPEPDPGAAGDGWQRATTYEPPPAPRSGPAFEAHAYSATPAAAPAVRHYDHPADESGEQPTANRDAPASWPGAPPPSQDQAALPARPGGEGRGGPGEREESEQPVAIPAIHGLQGSYRVEIELAGELRISGELKGFKLLPDEDGSAG